MTFEFTPTRTYHLLWRLDPPTGQEGYGLAATNENYARVEATPTELTLEHSADGTAKVHGPGSSGVLTMWRDGGAERKWVAVPKNTSQALWTQELKLEQTTQGGKDGFFVLARTEAEGPWERLRGDGLDQWIVRWSSANSDIERWRLSPTAVSATIVDDGGGLTIGGSRDASAQLQDWWHCFTVKNGTDHTLSYQDSAGETHTVAPGAEVLVTPKGTGEERTAYFSIAVLATQISLTMTRTNRL